MKKTILSILLTAFLPAGIPAQEPQWSTRVDHALHFTALPERWDEGIPLGNGLTGTLLWQREGNLRLALDRADLWDLRPVKEFSGPDYTFRFICDAVDRGDLSPVHELIDKRTSVDIAPSKIPAGGRVIPEADTEKKCGGKRHLWSLLPVIRMNRFNNNSCLTIKIKVKCLI